MSDTIEVNLRLPSAAWSTAATLANQLGLTPDQFITRAIGFVQTVETMRARGDWVGAAGDRERLDAVIVPPL